jgi:hypothetical protein
MGRKDEKIFFVFSGPQKRQKLGHPGNFFDPVPAKFFSKRFDTFYVRSEKNSGPEQKMKKNHGYVIFQFFSRFF